MINETYLTACQNHHAISEDKVTVRAADCKQENIYCFNYHPVNDSFYPFRCDGEACYVILSPSERCRYPIVSHYEDIALDLKGVEKFIDFTLDVNLRAQFYTDNMVVREFTLDDIKPDDSLARVHAEVKLVGQSTVCATRPISAGTCLGAYGGEVRHAGNQDKLPLLEVNKYASGYQVFRNHAKNMVVGDNILSRINTIIEKTPERGWHEVESGYNVIRIGVNLITIYAQEMLFPFYFAATDIKPGDELRVKYGYSDEVTERLMTESESDYFAYEWHD